MLELTGAAARSSDGSHVGPARIEDHNPPRNDISDEDVGLPVQNDGSNPAETARAILQRAYGGAETECPLRRIPTARDSGNNPDRVPHNSEALSGLAFPRTFSVSKAMAVSN